MNGGGARRLATAPPHVLHMLPRGHQDYFFADGRELCAHHVRSLGVLASERESEARTLFSEVMAKLLGAGVATETEEDGTPTLSPMLPHDDPKHDGRVAWLRSQIGGRLGLGHRQEE